MSWITEQLGISAEAQAKIIASLVVIILALVARALARRAVHRRTDETEVVYRTGKLATYAATLVVLPALAWIWLESVSSLATYLADRKSVV